MPNSLGGCPRTQQQRFCHSERSEESQLLTNCIYEILRFAQNDKRRIQAIIGQSPRQKMEIPILSSYSRTASLLFYRHNPLESLVHAVAAEANGILIEVTLKPDSYPTWKRASYFFKRVTAQKNAVSTSGQLRESRLFNTFFS